MRISLSAIAVSLVFGALTAQAAFACSCSAADGSCSASTTGCKGGCYAVCGAGGCSSGCTGPMQVTAPNHGATLTRSGQDVSASDLQKMVSDDLNAKLFFVPKLEDDRFTIEFNQVGLGDLVTGLSKVGAVAILEHGADRPQEKALVQHFTLKAENIPAGAVQNLLNQLFGDEVGFQAADPGSLVSVDIQNATLKDIRGVLPKLTGLRIIERN